MDNYEWDAPSYDFTFGGDGGYSFSTDDVGTAYTYNPEDPTSMFVLDNESWDHEYDDAFNTDYDIMFKTPDMGSDDKSFWDYANTPLGTNLITGAISGIAGGIKSEINTGQREKESDKNRNFWSAQDEARHNYQIAQDEARHNYRMEEIEAMRKKPGRAEATTSGLWKYPVA